MHHFHCRASKLCLHTALPLKETIMNDEIVLLTRLKYALQTLNQSDREELVTRIELYAAGIIQLENLTLIGDENEPSIN